MNEFDLDIRVKELATLESTRATQAETKCVTDRTCYTRCGTCVSCHPCPTVGKGVRWC